MKTATRSENVPTEPHFAILVFSSVSIPGDERSRTNPGHGYPAHDVSTVEYTWTLDRAEWEREVSRRMTSAYDRRSFIPVEVTPRKPKVTVSL